MNIKEGDTVRIIAEDDSEYGSIRTVTHAHEDIVWVHMPYGLEWRYLTEEVELVTKNASVDSSADNR